MPSGLPTLGLPTDVINTTNIVALLPTVISLVIVILAQSAATSNAYAMRYGDSFDENVDLIGLGLANIGAGISGTFVVNGSPTKTEMVDGAGGRSQISQMTAGLIVIVVLLFLTVPLSYMPNAVLASVVFLIGIRLIDVKGMREIARLRPGEFVVAAITAAVVVIVGVEQGIILAMALSIVEHINHSYHPHDTLLADIARRTTSRPTRSRTARRRPPGSRSTGSAPASTTPTRAGSPRRSWSSSRRPTRSCAGWVSRRRRSATSTSRARTPSRSSSQELQSKGLTVALCDLDPAVRAQLDPYGLTQLFGDHIYPTGADLLAAFNAAGGADAPAAVQPEQATDAPATGDTSA